MPSDLPEGPREVHLVFCGDINHVSVGRLFNALSVAINNKMAKVHLLFQSPGGSVGDGVCLYNFFRGLPIPLALYNCGSCISIAALAFLGAEERNTSAYATFMFHRTTGSFSGAPAERLHTLAQSIALDDIRTEAILRDKLTLRPEQWDQHRIGDLWLSAAEAVQCGLATGINEFSPPKGAAIYNV